MKVMRIAPDVYPIVIGGYPIHVHEMAKHQQNNGIENTVVAVGEESIIETKDLNYNINLFKPNLEIWGNRISLGQLKYIWKNRKKFDILHAHSHLFLSTNFVAICSIFGSAPIIITNHGLFSQTAPMWFQHFFLKTIGKLTYKRADKIICYTEVEKKELCNYLDLDKKKVYVIHNGIDLYDFIPKKDKNPGKKIKGLWIGRYSLGKGLDYLIKAISQIKEKERIKITLVGWGPRKKEYIQKIKSLKLKKNFRIKKPVHYEDIPKLYQEHNLFILPSDQEGFPRTIMEAYACGLVVLSSDLPQIEKEFGNNLVYFRRGDIKDLKKKLTGIIINYNEYLKGTNKRLLKKFSWEETVGKTIGVYEKTND